MRLPISLTQCVGTRGTMRSDNKLAAINAEAARWFVQLRDGATSSSEHRKYLEWLKQSPAHVAEMLRTCQLHSMLTAAGLETSQAMAGPAGNVVALGGASLHRDARTNRDVRRWKLAASVFGLASTVLLAVLSATAWRARSIETRPGEWRTVTLADGTALTMGPSSRIRVDFNDARRVVHFARGETKLDVAADSARPFFVNAELATVRAVGTAFGVTQREEDLIVTVAEGVVAVTRVEPDRPTANSASINIELGAGRQVSIGAEGALTPHAVDVQRVLAWADGWLVFEDETWSEAIDEFNRRNTLQIEISDPALRQRLIQGRYDARDPAGFATTLAATGRARVIREGAAVIRLEPGRSQSSRGERAQ